MEKLRLKYLVINNNDVLCPKFNMNLFEYYMGIAQSKELLYKKISPVITEFNWREIVKIKGLVYQDYKFNLHLDGFKCVYDYLLTFNHIISRKSPWFNPPRRDLVHPQIWQAHPVRLIRDDVHDILYNMEAVQDIPEMAYAGASLGLIVLMVVCIGVAIFNVEV
jgi:hypothetical protein